VRLASRRMQTGETPVLCLASGAAQAKLAAGDIMGAAMLHDAAVHSAEGT
jgi:hypothetical protein